MIGLILCGGLSTRMGSDKGLLMHQSQAWAQLAADKLTKFKMPAYFSVNAGQLISYQKIIDKDLLIADDISLELKGPLLGVLSAHSRFPEDDLFVLACDLLLMDNSVLQQLHDAYQNKLPVDVFIFTNKNKLEPLCGIYKATGLAKIVRLQKAGELKSFSMRHMLNQLSVSTISLKEDQLKFFQNFNAHAALNGL